MEFNRNQFMMIGVIVLALGVQFRTFESFTLSEKATQFIVARMQETGAAAATTSVIPAVSVPRKVLRPPTWLGWSLISVGLGADPAQLRDEKARRIAWKRQRRSRRAAPQRSSSLSALRSLLSAPSPFRPFDGQESAAGGLLGVIADGAIGANANHRLARFEDSLARHRQPRVDQAVRVEIEVEIGVDGLEGELVNGSRGAEIASVNGHRPAAQLRKAVPLGHHRETLPLQIDLKCSLDSDEISGVVER